MSEKYLVCKVAQFTNRKWYLDSRGSWRSSPDRGGVLRFPTLNEAIAQGRPTAFNAIAVESADGFQVIECQDLVA
jgi:hypothetical protein